MPFAIPESYRTYCTDTAVRTAVDHILAVVRRGILMEWTPPPDGMAMCQIGGVINAKWKERGS